MLMINQTQYTPTQILSHTLSEEKPLYFSRKMSLKLNINVFYLKMVIVNIIIYTIFIKKIYGFNKVFIIYLLV